MNTVFRAISFFYFFSSGSLSVAQEMIWKKESIHVGFHTNTAVAGDFTDDGSVDIIASSGGKVRLFSGPNWEETVIHQSLSKIKHCIHSEFFDVDNDGDLDYLAAHPMGSFFWLENPGKAAVGQVWKYRMITTELKGVHCLLKADVNRDGRLDVIVNNFTPNGPWADSSLWFESPTQPNGGWNAHVFAKGDARGGSHYFGFGDIDGDGWGEIAMGAKGGAFEDGNWFAYWRHPGGPEAVEQPWEKTLIQADQIGATNILPADLNGDGKIDFFASRGHGTGVLWYEAPDWTPHEVHAEIEGPHSLAIGDIDGDGDIDAASCGKDSRWVEWYENDGAGSFTVHRIDNAQASYDLRLVDIDGDRDLDILIAGMRSKNVVWYENPH